MTFSWFHITSSTHQMPTSDDNGCCLDMDTEAARPLAVPGVGTGRNDRWTRPYLTRTSHCCEEIREIKVQLSCLFDESLCRLSNHSLF